MAGKTPSAHRRVGRRGAERAAASEIAETQEALIDAQWEANAAEEELEEVRGDLVEAEESLLDISDDLQAAQAQLTEMSTVLRQTAIDRHNSKVAIGDYQKALMQAASLNIVSADKEKQLTDIVNETKRKALEMDQMLQMQHRDQEAQWHSHFQRLQSDIANLTPLDRSERAHILTLL